MVFFFLVRVQRSRHLFMHVRVMQWQSSQMRRYPFSMLQYICTTRPRLAKLMKSLAPSMNLSVLFFFSSFGEVAFFVFVFDMCYGFDSYFQLRWWKALWQLHMLPGINSTLTLLSFCLFQDFSHSLSMFLYLPTFFYENCIYWLWDWQRMTMVFFIAWICWLLKKKKKICVRNVLLFFLEIWIKSYIRMSTSLLSNSEYHW